MYRGDIKLILGGFSMKLSKKEIDLIVRCLSVDLSILEYELGIDVDILNDDISNIIYTLNDINRGSNHIEITN